MFVSRTEYKRVLREWEKCENELNALRRMMSTMGIEATQADTLTRVFKKRIMQLQEEVTSLQYLVIKQRRVMFKGSNMNQGLINAIRENFRKKLQERTSWGRNEVMLAFEQAVAEGALAFIDQSSTQQSNTQKGN